MFFFLFHLEKDRGLFLNEHNISVSCAANRAVCILVVQKKKLFLPVPPRKKLGKDKRNKSQEDNEGIQLKLKSYSCF